MSTSIQEQDLIQTIKQLEQRISDLERQQRTISGTSELTGNKAVTVRKDFSPVQYEQLEIDSNSVYYYYSDTSTPELNVDQALSINFTLDGITISNNGGDFSPGNLFLDQLTLVANWHDYDIPATTTSTGTKGMIKWNGTHLYLCTATNTWRRVALTTW
jgi:hypothetical protein